MTEAIDRQTAIRLGAKTYKGALCTTCSRNRTRYTSNRQCVMCAKRVLDTGEERSKEEKAKAAARKAAWRAKQTNKLASAGMSSTPADNGPSTLVETLARLFD